ncbi:MAG: hypothetical protein WA943_11615 [Parvibaculum sp.]|uniref:hypothetical protein n=1 Tax=Parvibaculum sp. TaxID=2024848 RepID=UPI003C7630FA
MSPAFHIAGVKRALDEQNAAVQEMEAAVNSIMDAVERMLSLDLNVEGSALKVVDCCSEIIEVCAFQDITGQRISQTIETLGVVDRALDALAGCVATAEVPDGTSLLNGPALPGQGLMQGAADDLFAFGRKA